MKRTCLALLLLVAAPAAPAELELRLWSPDLGGTAQVGDGMAGTRVDFRSDLGIEEDEYPDLRLVFRPTRRTSVRLGYTSLGLDGDRVLDRSIAFAGTTFDLSSRVRTDLELEYGRLGFAWQFLSTRDRAFRLGPLVGVNGLRAEAGLAATVLILSLSASDEVETAFASAGLALDAEPSKKVHLYAEWTTSVGLDEGELNDFEAALRYYPLRILAVTVGYRALEIDAEDGDDSLDFDLDGAFFGAVLRF